MWVAVGVVVILVSLPLLVWLLAGRLRNVEDKTNAQATTIKTIEKYFGTRTRMQEQLIKELRSNPGLRRDVVRYVQAMKQPRPTSTPRATQGPIPSAPQAPTPPTPPNPGVTPPPEVSPVQELVCNLTGQFCESAVANERALAIALFLVWGER